MPKSTQTRFLGIRDNHNHYTSLHLLFLIIIITDQLLFKACYPWSILDLHVGEINVLTVSNFDPHATKKASVGMYSGCDYLLSLKSCLCIFWHCHSLDFCNVL